MLEKYKIIVLALIISTLPIAANAQGGINSPYSMIGVGDLTANGFGRNIAMGSVMSSLSSPFQLNAENPASYSSLFKNSFIFEFGTNLKYYSLQNNTSSTSDLTGNISYISAGFPILKWWKSGIGLKPISQIGYEVNDIQKLNSEESVNNIYVGNGGINSLYFNNAFGPIKGVSVGVKVAYVFGSLDRDRTVLTQKSENVKSASAVTERNHSTFDAVAFGFGLQYTKKINKNITLGLGATYNLKTELSGEHDRLTISDIKKSSGQVFRDTITDENVSRGVLELPESYSFGASVILKQKLELAADYKIENWADTKMFGKKQSLYNNRQIAFGAELSPDYNSTKYFKLIKYRAGFHINDSYLSVKDEQLREIGYSIGFGFPLRKRTIINLSVSYDKRYVPGMDILTEQIIQVHLNLSFRGNWFIRSKFY